MTLAVCGIVALDGIQLTPSAVHPIAGAPATLEPNVATKRPLPNAILFTRLIPGRLVRVKIQSVCAGTMLALPIVRKPSPRSSLKCIRQIRRVAGEGVAAYRPVRVAVVPTIRYCGGNRPADFFR